MSTANIYIKQEINEYEIDENNITNLKSSDSVRDMSRGSLPECVYIKQEIQDIDEEMNIQNNSNEIFIKSESDIEKHDSLFVKTEPIEMNSPISSIKSEHEQHSDVDMPPEVDPHVLGSSGDVGKCLQSIDSKKQINSGDEAEEEFNCDANTLPQTSQRKSHQCTLCNKKFSRSSHLVTHLRTHTGGKPYECTVCDKKFSLSSHLVNHLRVHTGEKPYECTICDKKFSQSSHLSNHSRVHTGEKPYECTVCDKKFSVSSHLVRHVRIHTGEKPYECSVCAKKYSRSSDLVRHARIHTGEKPYECDICGKKFSRSSHLVQHSRTHTGKKAVKI